MWKLEPIEDDRWEVGSAANLHAFELGGNQTTPMKPREELQMERFESQNFML